jgi:hypothetical protein
MSPTTRGVLPEKERRRKEIISFFSPTLDPDWLRDSAVSYLILHVG